MRETFFSIEATLGGQAILTGPVNIDGIITAFACQQEGERRGKYLDDNEVDEVVSQIPLRKLPAGDQYLFATSIMHLESEYALNPITIYKAIRPSRMEAIGIPMEDIIAGVRQRYIGATSGSYKTSAPQFHPRLANKAKWVLCGDREAVEKILAGWTHLGKKHSMGYCRILKWETSDISDPIIMRHLPVEHYNVPALSFSRLRPPYWRHDGHVQTGIGDALTTYRGQG